MTLCFVIMPPEVDARALPAARATLEMIAALEIDTVIPGHGEPFGEIDEIGRAHV